MKKVFAGAVVAVFAFAVAASSQAALIKNINDSSVATSTATWLISVLMNNLNGIGFTNTVTSTGNSGANTHVSADDQSNSSVSTGNADSASLADNNANNNLLSEEYESSNGADNDIQDVDDSSVATTTSDDTLENEMNNKNETEFKNGVDSTGNSGTNAVVSGDSLSDSSTSTGNAGSASGVLNGFNTNIKSVVRRIMSLIP